MIDRRLLLPSLILVIAACGGAAAPTQRATTQPGATDSGAPVTAAPSTNTPSTSAPVAPPPGGGVDVQDPCALATVEEVAAALGTEVVAEADPGDTTSYCNYETADGSPVMALSFSRGNVFIFDTYANSDGAVVMPGVGDGAVVTQQGVLFIKRGDAVVGIQPFEEMESPEALISTLTALAQAVAARL